MKNQKLFVSLLALTVAGCVSTGKYKKLEADKSAQITALQGRVDQMEKDRAQLETEKGQLAGEISALQSAKQQNESQYQALIGQLSNEVSQGELRITQYKNMLSVDVAEQIFFASGSAKLKKTGQDVLRKVGTALAQYQDKMIRVVGHTDNVPLGKAGQNIFPSNWELSVIRATTVVRFLQDECKINPQNLIASGRAEYQPVAFNDTPEGRQKNRRIEIMLLDKKMIDAMEAK